VGFLPGVGVSLHHFLPVLPPAVAVIKDVDVAHGLDNDPRLAHRAVAGHGDPLAVAVFPPEKSNMDSIPLVPIKSATERQLGAKTFATEHSPSLGIRLVLVELIAAGVPCPRRAHAGVVVPEGRRGVLGRRDGRAAERVLGRVAAAGLKQLRRRAGVPARVLRLGVVVCALVHDLGDLAVQRPLHLLLGGAAREGALVVAARVLAPLHLLLPVLAPVVPVVRRPPLRLRLVVPAARRRVRCHRGGVRRACLERPAVGRLAGARVHAWLLLLVAPWLLLLLTSVCLLTLKCCNGH
jgi:hypothetical protein